MKLILLPSYSEAELVSCGLSSILGEEVTINLKTKGRKIIKVSKMKWDDFGSGNKCYGIFGFDNSKYDFLEMKSLKIGNKYYYDSEAEQN